MKHHPQKRTGFTLIECLAVIAVVAVLLSLLIVAVNRVREMAHAAECTSNLRNLGVGMRMYSQENDGKLPTAGNYNTVPGVGSGLSWMITLNEFLGQKFPDMNEKTMLLCPAALDTYPNGQARRTYGMNAAGTGGNIAMKLDSFIKPGATVLLMDTVHMNSGDGHYAFGAGSYSQYADWRHGGSLNVLFMDGHVENLKESESDLLREYVLNYQQRE